MKYLQDPEIQAAGRDARNAEIERLVAAGVRRDLATPMVDSFIKTLTKSFEREIMEHGTGGSPLFRHFERMTKGK